MQINIPKQSPPPRSWESRRTDLDTLHLTFRFMAVVLIATGALYLATVVIDFLRGQVGARAIVGVGAAAQLIGGTLLWRQPNPAGPDTVRKSFAIVLMAIGSGGLTYSLQTLLLFPLTDGADVLGLLGVFSLVLGSVLLVWGLVSVVSRRYAAWYQRTWEERWRRRSEKLSQRR